MQAKTSMAQFVIGCGAIILVAAAIIGIALGNSEDSFAITAAIWVLGLALAGLHFGISAVIQNLSMLIYVFNAKWNSELDRRDQSE